MLELELSLEDIWIKAAVEHKILEMTYLSAGKKELTQRKIDPDFVGFSRTGKTYGFWVTYCHLRKTGPRCFSPKRIKQLLVTDETFSPSPKGRWKELLPAYRKKKLDQKEFKKS